MSHTLELCGRLYQQVVGPLLAAHFPALRYSAALLGPGSEILGFDDEMSRDHHWGPRLMLLVAEADMVHATAIHEMLAHQLPYTFEGFSTHFTEPDLADGGTQFMTPIDQGPVNHRVTVETVEDFVQRQLAFDMRAEIEPADWLSFPEQRLLGVTAGAVYHDGVGLEALRARFAYYPDDLWRYRLAAGWRRIGQDEHLTGRAGYAGDELGSALIATRLVRDAMRLSFLMERRYAPYPKWFGRAFARLDGAPALEPALHAVLRTSGWAAREPHLVTIYETLVRRHNQLGLTEPVPAEAARYHNRPFRVIWGERIATVLLAGVRDPVVQRIAARPPIGGIDQFADSTDLLSYPEWRPAVRRLYA